MRCICAAFPGGIKTEVATIGGRQLALPKEKVPLFFVTNKYRTAEVERFLCFYAS